MKKLLILTLVIFLSENIYAQENTFSLQQCIEYALKNHGSVLNAQLDEDIAQQKVNELRGLGTPQIEGTADFNNFLEVPTSFVPGEFFGGAPGAVIPVQFGLRYSSSAAINASQLLFDGSYLVGLQASKTYQNLSRKQSKQTRTEAAVNVTKAYYGAIVSNARMDVIDANLERVEKMLSEIRVLNLNGFVEKLDVDRLELAYNNLLVDKEKVKRFETLSYGLLKFQMGYPAAQPINLSDSLEVFNLQEVSIPESVNLTNIPEYEVMTVNKNLQELDVKRYKTTYLPSLVAFGSIGYNNGRNSFDIYQSGLKWYPSALIGAKLTVPIWDGLQKSSRISQAKLALKKVDNALVLMKNGFELELESAKANYMNNAASLSIVKKNKELATEIARVSKVKYDNGVGSSLEVVDAESALREADANYLNTLYETIIARIDLDKASGNLNY